MSRAARFGALSFALLFAWILGACAVEDDRLPRGTPVVLISIDTLRADRLPAYGYGGVDTPAIDTFRRDALLFENAYCHTPLTLPSHTSLLTGLLPGEHGVRDNVGYVLDRGRVEAGSLPYLPTALSGLGYATGAAVSSFVLRGKMGLDSGFDYYEDSIEYRSGTGLGGLQRPGTETLRLASDWLRSVADRPFFLFFHIYEPHTPYQPPEPFRSRFPSPYDGEVAAADRIVGDLLTTLESLGAYERSLIILLSDHGEGLGEHGEQEHGVLLYRSTLRVPLLLKLPGSRRAGETIHAPAQLIDVYPTLAELLELPDAAPQRGRSLLRLEEPESAPRRIYSETFYPRLHFGWSELVSLVGRRYQLIWGPAPELYDLVSDPGQLDNLAVRERKVMAEMRRELEHHDRSLESPGEVDEETRRALAALGYVGRVATTDGPLPDPKSRLETLVDLKAGFHHHSRKEYREAADAFRRALEENPGMLDAWEFLARSLQKLGRTDEALQAFGTALEISGGSPQLALSAASLYFDLRRLDEAQAHAALAVDSHPSFAHGLLAQIALERGNLEAAETHARRALDERRLGPRITLARVLHARGEYEQALALAEEAERAFEERTSKETNLISGLHLLKGRILADLGRAEEAEEEFRREIELFPDRFEPYAHLAVLFALSGRPGRVGAELRRMVEANPTAEAYAEAVRTLRTVQDFDAAQALLEFARRKFPASDELTQLARPGA